MTGTGNPDLTYYCDDMRHLVCVPYTVENLHRMAEDLGIKRAWFHVGASYPHYDIPKRRIAEIQAKCTVISPRQLLAIVKGKEMSVKNDNGRLDELHLNVHGKVLFGAIAGWLAGDRIKVKIKGTKDQVQAVAGAMKALKAFQDELRSDSATMKTVSKKLNLRNLAIQQFEKVMGIKWPAGL
jgi:hypothetical protein